MQSLGMRSVIAMGFNIRTSFDHPWHVLIDLTDLLGSRETCLTTVKLPATVWEYSGTPGGYNRVSEVSVHHQKGVFSGQIHNNLGVNLPWNYNAKISRKIHFRAVQFRGWTCTNFAGERWIFGKPAWQTSLGWKVVQSLGSGTAPSFFFFNFSEINFLHVHAY